jgi:hypothetical protein
MLGPSIAASLPWFAAVFAPLLLLELFPVITPAKLPRGKRILGPTRSIAATAVFIHAVGDWGLIGSRNVMTTTRRLGPNTGRRPFLITGWGLFRRRRRFPLVCGRGRRRRSRWRFGSGWWNKHLPFALLRTNRLLPVVG